MKLSYIVPIFNVKPYLRKCVDSLLAQDYEEYELILVDDGSTDGSGLLADQLASRLSPLASSPIIQVIHQENRGLSGARNTGIELAKGEYICFVDSDDYWEENVLGGLMEQIEKEKLDVLRFKWQNVREKKTRNEKRETRSYEVFYPYKNKKTDNDFSSKVATGADFLNERMSDQCYAWQFILKRELADKCRFTEGILFEDMDWTPWMLLQAKRVASTSKIVYNYLWRENGITLTKSPEKLQRELNDKLYVLERIQQQKNGVWFEKQMAIMALNLIEMLGGQLFSQKNDYLKKIETLRIFPIESYDLTGNKRIKRLLINVNRTAAVYILHALYLIKK